MQRPVGQLADAETDNLQFSKKLNIVEKTGVVDIVVVGDLFACLTCSCA
jgi:hypothetical protein